jgi:DNA-binding transcriptional ArsR family regulator
MGEADLSAVGALLAEPARAKVLLALADGRALPASVLAGEAGVAPSTISHHLARLVEGGFLRVKPRGRHRYFQLAGPHIADLIEVVARIAPPQQVTSLREGTRAFALRYARRCYDHLAGRLGVAFTEALEQSNALVRDTNASVYTVTEQGAIVLADFGIPAAAGDTSRCCLDWTEQRPHIAGPVGKALLARLLDLEWLSPDRRSRALHVTEAGTVQLPRRFGFDLPHP